MVLSHLCVFIIVQMGVSVKQWLGQLISTEMLQRTYLRFIEEEATAKRVRAQIRPGDWSMVKRVDKKGNNKMLPP